ncbi:hypothetical protein [Rhodopseudomonas pseudopalustris]|uniref:Uncharacterized protein n=1 Tax=Rhodopseudomonas pseudopalustris TaxID=1513892 RepID=A0A1H8MSM6_9BRAD|nr:hypothetical protein [Rhodopseudomonas pseudopalustris]SEO20422.1 hypothetical protein SAMN05444123_101673 [Rhodopseudomonas pseudopalustris]
MSIIGFPLLLIPLAICNIVVFLMPGVGFDAPLTRIPLPSGTIWTISAGEMLVALGVLMLLFEVIKAARPGAKYLTDHLLSLLVLGGTVAEFVMLPQFGNATVFLLATLMLVDFLAGIALRHRPQPRTAGQARSGAVAKVAPSPEKSAVAAAPAEAPVAPSPTAEAASISAASIAEAVLLDRPQPVASAKASGSSPRIQSPGLQPADAAAGVQPPR